MTESVVDPYPSEYEKIGDAFERLQRMFEFTKFNAGSSSMMSQFNAAARDLFGEIGFEIDIHWDEVHVNSRPTGIYRPEVEISGRTRNEIETDHDQLKHEIRAGLADGKKGVVDPNTGEWKEEAKSKLII